MNDCYLAVIRRNNTGISPLEIMHLKTPEAVVHMLNDSLTANSHPSDGNLELDVDFR